MGMVASAACLMRCPNYFEDPTFRRYTFLTRRCNQLEFPMAAKICRVRAFQGHRSPGGQDGVFDPFILLTTQ
jgi:hypothetical protein